LAYRITEGETVEKAVRRIAGEQIDKAAAEIDDEDLGLHETVHEFRKRCKKIRGLLRLVRPAFPAFSDENAWYRDRSRQVSDVRDAVSVQECLAALIERYRDDLGDRPFAEVQAWLEQRGEQLTRDAGADAQLREFRKELDDAGERTADWQLDDPGIADVRAGVEKTYRRARKGLHRAAEDPTVENFHEWRKRVKYYRYQARLLTPAWPRVLRALHVESRRLSDLLGDDHDLAVLRETVVAADGIGNPLDHAALLALIDRRSAELRAGSLTLGRRLFHIAPRRRGDWIEAVLGAWESERRFQPPLTENPARAVS
jgi:CHAD domain-containing protein